MRDYAIILKSITMCIYIRAKGEKMSENFLKFKRKSRFFGILKSLLYGASFGLLSGGAVLILTKLKLLPYDPILALPLGTVVFLLSGLISYIIQRKSDKAIAKDLDRRFGLHERTATMLAYKESLGAMLELQREDTESALGKIKLRDFKIKRLWLAVSVFVISAAVFAVGLILPDMRGYEPPERVIPFELSEMQRAGLSELIRYVETSEMEEPYKSEIKDELVKLLSVLEETKTQPDMQAALAESMAFILASTSSSSSMTEIANALWNTEDDHARELARLINTAEWTEPEWGDYAEKYLVFRELYAYKSAEGEAEPSKEELKSDLHWKLENSGMKIMRALETSGISDGDKLYSVINDLINQNYDDDEGPVLGLAALADYMEAITYEESVAALNKTFDLLTESIYGVISTQKINTNVGEYTMTKLSALFLVPLPGFERPDFIKSGDGAGSDDGKDDNKQEGEGGGIGTGSAYGSDDLVLDPSTGEYVKYGTLLAKYYALMTAKLESGNYTDAQKEAITKYFELLYSGLKKDEDK